MMRDKVSSIKENYDKKFDGLFKQFKEIEARFLSGYFEEETLGELKISKERQKEIVSRITEILEELDVLSKSIKHVQEP